MNAKGKYFSETRAIPQPKNVFPKRLKPVSYYPFETELPETTEHTITIEVWTCRNCGKEYSENCGCNGEFEKHEVTI